MLTNYIFIYFGDTMDREDRKLELGAKGDVGTRGDKGPLGKSGEHGIREKDAEDTITQDDIEALTELYDGIPYETRIRVPKPKGYRKPDMEIPKYRKPRYRKQRYERGKISGTQIKDVSGRR